MVGLATSSTIEYRESSGMSPARTSSVDAAYNDPDLLIREYFLSSDAQRCSSRQTIIQHIKSLKSVFEILSRGASGNARNGYDGAANLLAEINTVELLNQASQAAQKVYPPMLQNSSTRIFAEISLEILIKAIACAYKLDGTQRLQLLKSFLPQVEAFPSRTRRIINASIIDALLILEEDADLSQIKAVIETFISDGDQYVSDYAREALEELG